MNIHTFQDAVASRRQTLADQFIDDDDDEVEKADAKKVVEGEEEEDGSGGKFNEAGEMITPFNMKDERESGFIDDDMNFVFKKEKQEVDAWVATLNDTNTEKVINDAALAERKRLARNAEQERNQSALDRMGPMEVKVALLSIMQEGESVQGTLRRLSGKTVGGNQQHEIGSNVQRRRPKQLEENDVSDHQKKQSAADAQRAIARNNRAAIERVTELADRLMSQGMTDIYSTTFEALQANTTRWEYQGADGRIYGPFTTQQIMQWRQQGFLTGDTAVMMRRVRHRFQQVIALSSSVTQVSNKKRSSDSIYDIEEEESSRKKMRTDESSGASAVSTVTEEHTEDHAWEHSDSIDFRRLAQLDAQVNTGYDDDNSNNANSGSSSLYQRDNKHHDGKKKSIRFQVEKESESYNIHSADDNEDDNDDDDEGFRRRRRSKQRGKLQDEEDDDDDDEEEDADD